MAAVSSRSMVAGVTLLGITGALRPGLAPTRKDRESPGLMLSALKLTALTRTAIISGRAGGIPSPCRTHGDFAGIGIDCHLAGVDAGGFGGLDRPHNIPVLECM
jgi:hypothetical protein